MSTSFDFWAHWHNVARIAQEPVENVRPVTNATDGSFTAPIITQTVLQFVVQQNRALVISRIEGFVHSVALQSVPAVFDIGAILELHAVGQNDKINSTANSVVNNDYVYTFETNQTARLDYTDISGIGTYRACFKWYGWLIPSSKIGNFVNVTTILGGN